MFDSYKIGWKELSILKSLHVGDGYEYIINSGRLKQFENLVLLKSVITILPDWKMIRAHYGNLAN